MIIILSAKEKVLNKIREIYSSNPFVNLCGINIEDISCGGVILGLTIDTQKHTNLYNNAHGGVIAALADTALGVSAATVSKRVVTSTLQVAFIKGISAGCHATAEAKVLSIDDNYMIICGEILSGGEVVAELMATMVIVGEYNEIPAVW